MGGWVGERRTGFTHNNRASAAELGREDGRVHVLVELGERDAFDGVGEAVGGRVGGWVGGWFD